MATLPPIYVINLKRNPERRLHIQRQLDALGLKYEFVEVDNINKHEIESEAHRMRIAQSLGIDQSLIENKYAAIIDHAKTRQNEKWKNDNLGSLAIALSHIKIYDLMVRDGIGCACILEDDATLLPTFPEVLRIAPQFEWDMLFLVSQPIEFSFLGYLGQTRLMRYLLFFRKFTKCLLSSLFRLNNFNTSKQRTYPAERLLEVYGINSHLYPRQSERISQICREYYTEFEEIIKAIMPDKPHLVWTKFRHYRQRYSEFYPALVIHTAIQFGAFPETSSLQPLTEHHCIAKPKYPPLSATGYLVNQKLQ